MCRCRIVVDIRGFWICHTMNTSVWNISESRDHSGEHLCSRSFLIVFGHAERYLNKQIHTERGRGLCTSFYVNVFNYAANLLLILWNIALKHVSIISKDFILILNNFQKKFLRYFYTIFCFCFIAFLGLCHILTVFMFDFTHYLWPLQCLDA